MHATIQTTTDSPPFTAPGWVHLPEHGWAYLHAAGAITAAGPQQVPIAVTGRLAFYALPDPPGTPEEIRGAAAASFGLLDWLPPGITAPLLGLAYRAVLSRTSTMVLLTGGDPGYGTTALAFAIGHHLGDLWPLGDATLAAVHQAQHAARDTLVLVDNASPDLVESLAREHDNAGPTPKASASSAPTPKLTPHSSLLVTAEIASTSQPVADRVLQVQVPTGTLTKARLKILTQPGDMWSRSELTASYLRWVAARHDEVLGQLPQIEHELAAVWARHGAAPRRAQALAELAAGWRFQLEHLADVGAYPGGQASVLWEHAWAGLAAAQEPGCDAPPPPLPF